MTTTENRPIQDETASKEFRGSQDQPNANEPLAGTNGYSGEQGHFSPTSAETLVGRAVAKYLTEIVDDQTVTLSDIRDELLRRINAEFSLENVGRTGSKSPSGPIVKIQYLDERTVTSVLLARYRIVSVDLSEGEVDDMTLLAMYVDFGDQEGTYSTSERQIKSLASQLKPSMNSRALDSVYASMRVHAPLVERTSLPHLVPVGNGVFDHAKQVLRPFSPDWVFLSKIPTEYDPNAQSPVIAMPDGVEWTFDGWLRSLSDDEGVPELLWEVISACVRSYLPWNKALWLVSERGNNGKGTLVQLIRNLLGKKACSAVPFADFGHEFKMEPLIRSRVNLVDENGVGTFAERIDTWKAFVTGDTITMNRKHKTPVAVSWRGIDIQCLNSFNQRTKDRSESFYRRLLIIPFNKWFGDSERKYIKRDYLARTDVLQYVLKRALEMRHTEFSNPAACREALDEYRGTNNALLSFWNEFKDQLIWDLIPFRFLYALYREWFRRVNPSGQTESMNAMVSFLKEHLATSPDWEHKGSVDVRPKQMMAAPEPLIVEYGLTEWMNDSYSGSDPLKRAVVSSLKPNYKGLVRRQPSNSTAGPASATIPTS